MFRGERKRLAVHLDQGGGWVRHGAIPYSAACAGVKRSTRMEPQSKRDAAGEGGRKRFGWLF
jgi:hypothetical protein